MKYNYKQITILSFKRVKKTLKNYADKKYLIIYYVF